MKYLVIDKLLNEEREYYNITDAYKKNAGSDGLFLKDSYLKKSGENSYLVFKFENTNNSVNVYRVITAMNNYLYSINLKIDMFDSSNEKELLANLDTMLGSLKVY